MAGGPFEQQKTRYFGLAAQISALSNSGWADPVVGRTEIRALRAGRSLAESPESATPGITIVRHDLARNRHLFLLRCNNLLLRVAVENLEAEIIRSDKMQDVPLQLRGPQT